MRSFASALLGFALTVATSVAVTACSAPDASETTNDDGARVDSSWTKPVYADYGSPLRRPDGHIDTPGMIARLRALHATTYAFLLWGWRYQSTDHYDTDFDDLASDFLPAAERAGIDVWAYLASPTEMRMHAPPPCRADYVCWGDKLGALAAAHPNLREIVIDDFFSKPNAGVLTADYAERVRAAARAHTQGIGLFPVAYFTNAVHGLLRYDYASAIDGVIFVNLNRTVADTDRVLPDQLAQMNRVLREPVTALNLHLPASNDLQTGDAISLSKPVTVGDGAPRTISFVEGDDLFAKGPTTPALEGANGTRMVQLLVNGNKVWERDLNAAPAPGETPGYQRRTVDVGAHVTPGRTATVTFRVIATGAHAGMPDIDVNVFDVSGSNVTFQGDPWKRAQYGDGDLQASAPVRDYRGKRNVLMVYASTLAGGWTPDTGYIVSNVTWAQPRIADGELDGVITYQLDKTSTAPSSTFGQLASLYAQYEAAH
jgi:hypothetical protein